MVTGKVVQLSGSVFRKKKKKKQQQKLWWLEACSLLPVKNSKNVLQITDKTDSN